MNRQVFSYIIAVMVIAITLQAVTTPVNTATSSESIPLGWEHPSIFKDLLTSYTAHVKPGGTVTVHLAGDYTVKSAYIFAVLQKGSDLVTVNKTVSVSVNNDTVTLGIPSNTPSGVYDLFIDTNDGLYRIPQSIWVSENCSLPIRIAHFTDEHFDLHPDYYTSAAILAKLLGVQLYLGTGDATDTASEMQAKHYVMHRSSFLYGIPALENPGNHDHESDTTGTPFFKKYIAPEYWYRNFCNKILVIGLNTGKERDVITRSELEFMEHVLENNPNVPVKIVTYHHPFFWHHGNVTSTYNDPRLVKFLSTGFWYGKNHNISLEFLKYIEQYRVELTLQGHVHSDSIVNFTSTMTGYRTWFVTTTTIGGPHSPKIYNGFEVMDVYPNDTVKFPFAPPTFNVPVTHDVNRGVYPKLSIPVQDSYPEHFYAKYYSYSNTFAIEIENTLGYLNVSGTTLIRVPWSQKSIPAFYVTRYSNTGSIQVVNATLPGDGYLYLLLKANLPNGTHLILVGTTQGEDNTPPTALIKMTIPRKPRIGTTFTIYIKASDEGWGIKSLSATLNGEKPLAIVKSGSYYLIGFKLEKDNTNITLNVEDLAGHKSIYIINIKNGEVKMSPYQPPQQTSTTSTSTTTTTSTTTSTATSSTTSSTTSTTHSATSTSTATSSSASQTGKPTRTTSSSTSTSMTSSTSQSTTQSTTSTSSSKVKSGNSYSILWISIIVAVLIILGALIAKK
ncbi:MAG: metallophosphoesterase [Desulfurococcales archaeon]|nr:metallophosphoesterase [Desulfurococcales archaeon]